MTQHRFDPDRHHRRSIRLQGYDDAQAGAYFVTICMHQRVWLFGEIVAAQMRLNTLGQIVAEEWQASATIRAEIEMDAWVVMPNHFHAIAVIVAPTRGNDDRSGDQSLPAMHTKDDRRGDRLVAPMEINDHHRNDRPRGPVPQSLGALIAGFKAAATKRINQIRHTPGTPVWQRNYWERIIRSDADLNRIREYIRTNPARWKLDQLK